MTGYLIRRFLQSIGFILLVWFAIYTLLVMVMPGGPAQAARPLTRAEAQAQGRAPGSTLDAGDPVLQADKAWPLNFFLWLFNPNPPTQASTQGAVLDDAGTARPTGTEGPPNGIDIRIGDLHLAGAGALTGNFGKSQVVGRGQKVSDMLGQRWSNTVILVVLALITAFAVAIPVGIIAALRYRSPVDHTLTFFFSFLGFSLPPFSLGVILIMLFAVIPYLLHLNLNWDWMPYLPSGDIARTNHENDFFDRLQHLVLPVATLAIPQIAWLSRHVRFSMLEILKLDYIRTAWAKGLPMRRVVLKHALRNALIPLITSAGLMIPVLIAGTVIVESVFAYPGLGQVFFQALGGSLPQMSDAEPGSIGRMDYALTLALMFFLIMVVAVSNMLVDMLYTVADPRINFNQKSRA